MIEEVWLPAALRMGISINDFWDLNPKYMYIYQEAYIKDKEEQLNLMDASAFYNGIYVQQAIASCFDKKVKYPKKPLFLQRKEKKLDPEEQFLLWIERYNKKFDQDSDVS